PDAHAPAAAEQEAPGHRLGLHRWRSGDRDPDREPAHLGSLEGSVNSLVHTRADGTRVVKLDPRKRVLFLTKDLSAIERQLRGELDLRMDEVDPGELLDDINTDVMTPAWVCFRHRPEDIALDAYAGLMDAAGKRVFGTRALLDGGFQVIVSGQRKGTGS